MRSCLNAGLLAVIVGCAASTPKEPTAKQWEAKGDEVAATDPATAIGNYRWAELLERTPERREKIRRLMPTWLAQAIEKHRPELGKNGADDVAYAYGIEKMAEEYDVQPPEELKQIEAAGRRLRWLAFRDEPRANAWERMGWLESARLLRPLSEEAMPAEVRGRVRYEVRYTSWKDAGFGVGARGWCSFEQTTTGDTVVPSGPTAVRSCTVVGVVHY